MAIESYMHATKIAIILPIFIHRVIECTSLRLKSEAVPHEMRIPLQRLYKSSLMKKDTITLFKRVILLIAGMFGVALGVALVTRANLGTSPAACPPYVLSLVPDSPLTMGAYMFIMQSIFVLSQVAIFRKKFKPFQFFQLAGSFLFGFYTDLTMWMTEWLQSTSYILRWVQLVGGCAVTGLGCIFQIKAQLLMLPGEGLVLVISQACKLPFSKIKIANDVVLTLVGIAISLIFIGPIEGVREGTVASAFLGGIMVRVFTKPTAFIDRWLGMNEKKEAIPATSHQVITIAREWYSGGSEIGKLLAERLGVKCYDRTIIEQTA